MNLKEKRKHQRVDVSIVVQVHHQSKVFEGKLSNLSKGGAAFSSKSDFGNLSDPLDLVIPLPGAIEVTVTSQVVRKERRGDSIFYGLRFEALETNLQSHLLSLIETLIRHSSGDQRKYARVYRRLPVRYKHLSELEAVLENVSMGGLSMLVEKPHVLFDTVEVSIPNLEGGELMRLQGKIVHQSPVRVESTLRYKVGIEFEEIPQDQKEALHVCILRILDMKKTTNP